MMTNQIPFSRFSRGFVKLVLVLRPGGPAQTYPFGRAYTVLRSPTQL